MLCHQTLGFHKSETLVKNTIIFSLLLLISTTTYAGSVTSTINRIGTASAQYAILIVDNAAATKPDCAEEYTIFSFDKFTAHGQDMYSMALTAFATQKRLIIQYSDTVCGLNNGRALVTRMDIIRD